MSEPKSLDKAFEQVCREMTKMFVKKHRDYGKGNILSIKELGIAFRETEKIERVKNMLMSGKKPANESVEETWIDIGVYAVIAVLLRRGWFEKLEIPEK